MDLVVQMRDCLLQEHIQYSRIKVEVVKYLLFYNVVKAIKYLSPLVHSVRIPKRSEKDRYSVVATPELV